MIAAMGTNSHTENRDEKKDQLSPEDEEDLEEIAARYHSDEDWPLLDKDAPRSLRETSPVRRSAPRSSKESSPIRPSAPMSLRDTSPIRPSVRFKHQTVKRSPEYKKKDMGCYGPLFPHSL